MTSRDLYLSRKKIYLRVSDVPTLTPVCRQVEIPLELIPIVNSLLFWLTRRWAWSGTSDDIDAVINAISRLMYDLVDSECDAEPTPPTSEVIQRILSDFEGEEDCEDESEEECMACIKKIRLFQGRLQISYSDNPCDDCWIDIADLSEVITSPADVGEILLDAAGAAAKLGAKINFSWPTPRPQERTLAQCAKATALFDAWAEMLGAILGTRSTWIDLINDVPFAKNLVVSALLVLLPAPFKTLLKARVMLDQLAALAGLDLDALENEFEAITRSEVICVLTDYMDATAEITGEDILALATTVGTFSMSLVETVHRVFRMLDPIAFAELMTEKYSDFSECGCENITNPTTPDNLETSLFEYDWSHTFDLAVSQNSFQSITQIDKSFATWTEGIGFVANLVSQWDIKRAAIISRDMPAAQYTGMKIEYSAELGEWSESSHPRWVTAYDITTENYIQYGAQNTRAGSNSAYFPMTAKGAGFTLRLDVWSVDTGNDIDPPAPDGAAIIKKLTVFGTGTNPFA